MNFQLPSIGKQEESFQGRELSEAGFSELVEPALTLGVGVDSCGRKSQALNCVEGPRPECRLNR